MINDRTASPNTVVLAAEGVWYDNSGIAQLAKETLTRSTQPVLRYMTFDKAVNNSSPNIEDTVQYTLRFDLAKNIDFAEGTTITDVLPDGLTFSRVVSTSHPELLLQPQPIVENGKTTLHFVLSGTSIEADTSGEIVYEVLVDGDFE